MVSTFMNLPEGFLQALPGCKCQIAPHSHSTAYKKGMVINGINNILLRGCSDNKIICMRADDSGNIVEGQGNLGSELVFVAIKMLPHSRSITVAKYILYYNMFIITKVCL